MPELKDVTKIYAPFGSGLPRSPGLHLTTIIRDLRDSLGMGKKAEGWDMNICADIGFLWEDAFAYAYRDRMDEIYRPNEFVIDGISLSPDGVGVDPETGDIYDLLVNYEYKCTWRSSKRIPTDDFYWDTQFKCYCYGLNTNITILHVFYVMGDYRGSGPVNRTYRIEYTDQEIETAWGMVKRHAEEKGWL